MDERRFIAMSNVEWFKNEIEFVNEFLEDTRSLLEEIETADIKLSDETSKEKESIEKALKEKLQQLQDIKNSYMGEELLDTIETLTSVDEGEEIADQACEVLKKINQFIRKYNGSYLG